MTLQPQSFRDPGGQLLLAPDRAIRLVRQQAFDSLQRLLASQLYAELVGTRALLPAERSTADPALLGSSAAPSGFTEPFVAAFEQPRIRFVSYASEWPPEMLHAAAALTLEIAKLSLPHGWCLKDATPSNVAFEGPRAVFLDILSLEERDPGDPLWLPYGQFVRTFLLPLLISKRNGGHATVAGDGGLDGVEPEEIFHALSFREKLTRPALGLVTLPTLLSRKASRGKVAHRPHVRAEQARFVLNRLFRRLDSALDSVAPRARKSHWTGYPAEVHDPAYHAAKEAFVTATLASERVSRVLDVGCNVGRLSLAAAATGASVVAIDSDAPAVGQVYRSATGAGADILPLVVDIANPTPGRGWRNREQAPFLERARGAFDCVLAMAVMHHLMLSSGIPLAAILEILRELSTNIVMIEFIPRTDPMFTLLARGRDELYRDHTRERFLALCQQAFVVGDSRPVGTSGREVFVLRRKPE